MANARSITTWHERPPSAGRRWLAPSALLLLALSLGAGCEFAPPLTTAASLPDARVPTDLPRDVPFDVRSDVPFDVPLDARLDAALDAPIDRPGATDAPDVPAVTDVTADRPDACVGPGRALCEGACVSLAADPHCGACGNRCSFAHAAASCADGRCVMGACDRDFADCNASPADGCEVNIAVGDATHCGGCGRRCPAPPIGGRAVCSAGTCGISTLVCPSGLRDCNGVVLDGCEAAVLTDVNNCGSCGAQCPAVGGVASCAGGLCAIACTAGLGNCDGMSANGCETNVRASAMHCGACGRNCVLANARAGCAAGACTVAACNMGFGDCDRAAANGCETNLSADNRHCGACGNVCPGGQTCVDGACRVTCAAGQRVCAGLCVNVQTDNSHCGACGAVCAGGTRCVGGACQCPTGQALCAGSCRDLSADNGNCGACARACGAGTVCSAGVCTSTCAAGTTACSGVCRDLTSDPAHCMACGRACAFPNGVAGCRGGQCFLAACAPGFADCDGMAANGCETNTGTASEHCGVCGNRCQFASAGASCVGGRCVMGSCSPGFRDCNANAVDGCEVNAASGDTANCGGCGVRCPAPPVGTSAVCAMSTCGTSSVSCPSDRRDCNAMSVDGCETTILTDVNNCGGCGVRCATTGGTAGCAGGVCTIACGPGLGNCDGSVANGCETSTATSAANCGGCNVVCTIPNASASCVAGACGLARCNEGFGDCDGVAGNGCERNLVSDNAHCGACGAACPAGRVCSGGNCQVSCGSLAVCSGTCRDTSIDPDNCGACGAVCSPVGMATRTCGAGACNGLCAAGRADCNNNRQTDGCETDVNTTVAACGGCGMACSTSHVTAACAGGACTGACEAGFADCDANKRTNGCETAVTADVGNCGGCGVVCPTRAHASATCAAGACGYTCTSGFRNCDADDATGCEADLSLSGNCGACGVVCPAGQACAMTAGLYGCL
ncbi:MAG: hypothetical protein Q8S73_24755 [Deltaproteobacteria bacterium]|nr:hypothetical protein [Myxococcales bacterium]MDP3217345.1 hypothetical protein [Deltaproteobacteria bacterium]